MASLAGKNILVTGSSRGIGAATVKLLASRGASVVIHYVGSKDAAAKLVDEINGQKGGKAVGPVQADLATVDGPKKLADESVKLLGSVDAVVHTAGVMPATGGLDFKPEGFDEIFYTNLRGPLLLTQALEPQFKAGSAVVFISTSITRANMPPPREFLYTLTKGATEQAVRIMSKQYGQKGVRVLGVAPGPTATELFLKPKTEEQINFFKGLSPWKRLGEPEEIAKVIAFAVSDEASWVAGSTLFTNGANQV